MLKATIVVLFLTAGIAFAQAPPAPTDPNVPRAVGPDQGPPGGERGAPPPWVIPHFRLLREEEDWTYLANPQNRGHDWADPLKYIPLAPRENWYLTLGGEVREWYEVYKNENWGTLPFAPADEESVETNGYLKQRFMFNGDFHLGDRFRVFAQVHSGFVNWRFGGPRDIVDKDKLDLNQGFVDINFLVDRQKAPKVTLRLGRQEMHFGTGRLVSVREVPNVRAGFDGARLILNIHNWHIDTFATKPVFTQPGFFDDRTDHEQTFWGTFATGPLPGAPFNVDAYYLGLKRKVGVFGQGIGPEERHTVGARIWRGGIPFVLGEGWDYDAEYALQFGSFGPGPKLGPTFPFIGFPKANIKAWTVSTQTGYTFNGTKLQPRVAVNTGITSGDKDPFDPDLQTFFTPFPNGRFFGAIQTNGPLNIQGFRPSVTIQLPRRATLTADAYFFWRQSLNDALYNVPGFPLRPGDFSQARYVGTQPGAELFLPLTNHVTVDVNYARFVPGQFLHENPPDKNLDYLGLIFFYRF